VTAPGSGAASSRPASPSPRARCSRLLHAACGRRWRRRAPRASAPPSGCIRPSATRISCIWRPRSPGARSSSPVSSSPLPGAPASRPFHALLDGLLGLGRPLRPVFDAELFHLVELLAPERLLLVDPASLGDLVPLLGGGVERVLGRLALGQRLGDLERALPLVLVGGRDHRIRDQEREAL